MAWRACLVLLVCVFVKESYGQGDYLIGAGIADITGPAADVPMMGYAKPDQSAGGIHLRLYCRTIITCELDETHCNVFVNADIGMGATAINLRVFEILRQKGLGDRYNEKNTAISATHTHSGPGGYHQFFLFTVTTSGFQEDSLEIIVEGVVRSIERAHENLEPGNIYWNEGELLDTSINRSPTAYDNNPADEKRKYEYNTDKEMTLAKFVSENGTDIGLISWFAVHPVSMNNSNHLISSDNKGYASYLFEQDMNDGAPMGHQDGFVAIFANSNHGDTSPNTAGPKCIDTGRPCNRQTSTCQDRAQLCIAFGPGKDMFDSTRIIGENQYLKAKELYDSATDKISGPIRSIYQHVNMTNYPVKINDTYTAYTCSAAMGYSFAAGTIDGPGEFTFFQGDTEGSELWDSIRDLIKKPSDELVKCQAPKPVLLPTGEIFTPWTWAPAVVQIQMLRIGQLVISLVPGEFTTMAGRRLRNAVRDVFKENGVDDVIPTLTGLANTYTDYVTTFEEYQIQRYEGASTVFGQHTLQAYIQQYSMLAEYLVKEMTLDPGPASEDYLDEQKSYLDPPNIDATPSDVAIGDVYIDTDARYRQGGIAVATFWAGNPRHDTKAMVDSTFVSVELYTDSNMWLEMFNDADWSTRFYWDKKVVTENTTQSLATVRFEIPEEAPLGTYRIKHQGFYKVPAGNLQHYEGYSSPFQVLRKNYKRGGPIYPTTAAPPMTAFEH